MKYIKEIKKGLLIAGTIIVFALVAIIILFIVANLDYDFINSAWSDLMHIFHIKNEQDLQISNYTNTNETQINGIHYTLNQKIIIAQACRTLSDSQMTDEMRYTCSKFGVYR